MRLVVGIFSACVLAACGSNAAKGEDQTLAAARANCTNVDVSGYSIKLLLGPKPDGKKPSKAVLEAHPGATGESLLFQSYWSQNLCALSYTTPGFPTARIPEWEAETGEAFAAWRPLNPQSYNADRAALVAARKLHLPKLDAQNMDHGTKGGPIGLDFFNKAFPNHDFFRVMEFDAGIDLGSGTKYKGVDLSKLDPRIAVTPDQFSNSIRPALSSVRQAVGFYAMNKITDVEMVRIAVAAVYQAGITRIDDAKLAQKAAPAAPAASAASAPKQ